ncbi:MAG: helix-turn-helix transcriptional regulator [Sulfuritalea sp.]|nr:helix-turn-helix transcriptional regulator [Sulfuritalea sp.]
MSTTAPHRGVMPYGVLLGQVLKAHRDRLAIEQKDLAASIGTSQSAYSRMETGHTAVTVPQLRTLSRTLGTSAGRILAEVDQLAKSLETQGIDVPDQRETNAAAVLIGLGVLLALLSTGKG